jgi:hypothetical protein
LNESHLVPALPMEILEALLPSDNPFVEQANQIIGQLNELGNQLPRRYGWRFRTVAAFRAEQARIAKTATDALSLNTLYWKDMLATCEAYALTTTWRMVEIARSGIWALVRQDLVCAALLARSALESAAQFADAARTVSTTIGDSSDSTKSHRTPDAAINLHRNVLLCKPLEEYLLKTMFASRLPSAEDFCRPTNIVTIIQRISKSVGQEFVCPTYETLCEVAHPNFLGRSLYLLDVEPGQHEGEEVRTIGPGIGPTGQRIVAPTVAGLAWACGTQVSAFGLMSATIQAMLSKLAEVL